MKSGYRNLDFTEIRLLCFDGSTSKSVLLAGVSSAASLVEPTKPGRCTTVRCRRIRCSEVWPLSTLAHVSQHIPKTLSKISPTKLLPMVGDICSRSTFPSKYCPSSTAKGFSTTSPMRIMALLGGRVCDPLHINREKIEISQVFIEILGFKGRSKSGRSKGMSGTG